MNLKQSPGGSMVFDFRDHIRAFAEKTNRKIGETHRAVSIKLFSAIILDTPVDTGEAASGWRASYGKIWNGASGYSTKGQAMNALRVDVKAETDQITFLSNSVHHITGLEYGTHWYGYSPKAPRGMVRINVTRFQRLISEEIARINK